MVVKSYLEEHQCVGKRESWVQEGCCCVFEELQLPPSPQAVLAT